jgi:hypothetical protein
MEELTMPRGIPRNRANGAITKMEGVRRALTDLGKEASPKEIQDFLKSKFGIEMNPSMVSNYKSSLKSSGKAAKRLKAETPAVPLSAAGGISLDDIRAVKEVVDKLGADKVRQLAELLGK